LVDCAPIAIAQETKLFEKHGLNVELMREPGWATIRDKMAYGQLEAAHAPVGLSFALNWGLGVLRHPCLTGYLLNSNGDAITISTQLHEAGVTDSKSLAIAIRSGARGRPFTFGVPHLFSTHHFLLLQWLRPAGIIAGRDVQIIILPPSLMSACLASGDIDGYCVGEPYNSIAVSEETGVILAESANISPMHPEKALIVSQSFEDHEHSRHIAMVRAIAEAAQLCETPEGRELAARVLSLPKYLGMNSTLIRSSLIADDPNTDTNVSSKSFHVFSHPEANRPSTDKANWILTQMRNANLLDGVDTKSGPPLKHIFREDLFEEAIGTCSETAA
tara:strand:+ start:4096 stop:5091 length:996 start_codon:yes stop_codon:yes gene_type:complete